MSGADAARPWPGQPAACTCTRMIAAAIEETLGCADGWRWVPGTGWVHRWPLQRPGLAAVRRERVQVTA